MKILETIDVLNSKTQVITKILFEEKFDEISLIRSYINYNPVNLNNVEIADKLIDEFGKKNANTLISFGDYI